MNFALISPELRGLMSATYVFFDLPYRDRANEREHAPFPPVNIYENAAEVRILALVPGAGENDVRVSMDKGELRIAGEINKMPGGLGHRRERFCGCFCRRIKLLMPFGPESLTFEVRNGMVNVRLQKS